MIAINTPFQYHGVVYSLNFRGGIKQRVEVNRNNPNNSVLLRTIGFKVTGTRDEGSPTVVFEQSDVDGDPQSTLTLTQNVPPKYEERDVIPFTATIEEPGHAPVVLQSKNPMVLRATLSRYPATGDRYQLEKPVELVEAAHPDTVVATLNGFPAQRSA
jgi:hypothetical protein